MRDKQNIFITRYLKEFLEQEFLKLDVKFTDKPVKYVVYKNSQFYYSCVSSCRTEDEIIEIIRGRFSGDIYYSLVIYKVINGHNYTIFRDVPSMRGVKFNAIKPVFDAEENKTYPSIKSLADQLNIESRKLSIALKSNALPRYRLIAKI